MFEGDFPIVESEKEKTREELLEEFKSSLEEYGVPMIRHEKTERDEGGG